MHLLSPLYLLGLAAIALPVLIHLIRHRKVTVVAWAAHRFLNVVLRRLQRKRRLNDLLLLLLRCLLFVLLALLFARPFMGGSGSSAMGEAQTVILVLDASGSMGSSNGVRSNMDAAREQGIAVLAGLAPGSEAGLIVFSEEALPVVSPPVRDLDLVRRELERVSALPAGSNLAPALEAAMKMLKGKSRARIVVITDARIGVWSEREKLEQLGELAAENNLSLQAIRVGDAAPNLGIVSLASATERPITGQPLAVTATVRNGGSSPSVRTRMSFSLDDDAGLAEAWLPALEPGQSAPVVVELRIDEPGWHSLSARLSGDGLALDDVRSIGLFVGPKMRVALVEGPTSPCRGVAPGFFLKAAAVPVPVKQRRNFPVAVESWEAAQLTENQLEGVSVVMLAGVTRLERAQQQALLDFLRNGGGVLVTPPAGERVREAYVTRPVLADMLPLQGLSFVESEMTFAAGPPYASPITAWWDSGRSGSLQSFVVSAYLRGTLREGATVVLPLEDGSPLLSSIDEGAGRVLFASIPLEASWSELPLSPQFVPLVQRSLQWLAAQSEAPAEVSPGERWSMDVAAAQAGQPFYVSSPRQPGLPLMAGEVEYAQGRGVIAFSTTADPGVYRVYLDPEGEPVGAFGVNPSSDETDLRAQPDDLAPSWAYAAGISGDTAVHAPVGFLARLQSYLPEIWTLIAYVMLLLGAVELYLAQRFSRPA